MFIVELRSIPTKLRRSDMFFEPNRRTSSNIALPWSAPGTLEKMFYKHFVPDGTRRLTRLRTAYCSPLTAHCDRLPFARRLPIMLCLVFTAYCSPLTAHCVAQAVDPGETIRIDADL